ncbi:MAG TPA: hypothetical protein VGL97_09525 [Bryobacteraceae bacterium]
MKGQALQVARTKLAELQDKFGLAMRGPDGASLFDQAAGLKLPRTVLSPPKIVVPCAAELRDTGKADPCLIVPSTLPIELLPDHKSLAVGGQILSIGRSMFTLSPYLMDEAWRAQGYWNGQPLPLVVSIRGVYKYLLKQKSYFFRCENFVGSDIDQLSPMEPDEKDLKLGRYKWGSDLLDELTLVVAEY